MLRTFLHLDKFLRWVQTNKSNKKQDNPPKLPPFYIQKPTVITHPTSRLAKKG